LFSSLPVWYPLPLPLGNTLAVPLRHAFSLANVRHRDHGWRTGTMLRHHSLTHGVQLSPQPDYILIVLVAEFSMLGLELVERLPDEIELVHLRCY
jgi:hypothetical protein